MGSTLEYDDIYQEVCSKFPEVAANYDSSKGRFSTYFVWAIYNHFNNVLFKREERFVIGLGLVRLDAYSSNDSSDAEGFDLLERLDVETSESPEEILQRRQEVSKAVSNLSPLAQKIVQWMIDPPDEMIAETERIAAFRYAQTEEEEAPARYADMKEVCDFLTIGGVDAMLVEKARKEVLTVAKRL